MKEKEILVQRGYKQTIVNVMRGSWSVKKLTSEVNSNVFDVIQSSSINSEEEFLCMVEVLLNKSECISIFTAYLIELSVKYPEYAAFIDFNQIDPNFDLDSRLLHFINSIKVLVFYIVLAFNDKINLSLFIVLIGIMLNGIDNVFKTSCINNSWGNTKVFTDLLESEDVSILTKFKIKQFLGHDMMNQSKYEMINCLYDPEINLDYEFLFSHPSFDYYRIGTKTLTKSVLKANTLLDAHLIMFEVLLKSSSDEAQLVSQLKVLLNHFIKKNPDTFLALDFSNLKVVAQYCPELFVIICRKLPYHVVDFILDKFSFDAIYSKEFLYLDYQLDDVDVNLDFQSAKTVSEKIFLFFDLFSQSLNGLWFKESFFDEAFDFSRFPKYELREFRSIILENYIEFEKLFYELVPFASRNFLIFFSQQFNLLLDSETYCDNKFKITLFDEFDKFYFDEFTLTVDNFVDDLDIIFEEFDDKSEFLNSLFEFININTFYCSKRNINELFSAKILAFLNENKFWERFNDDFFLKNAGVCVNDNVYLSIINAFEIERLQLPGDLNEIDAFTKFGFVFVKNSDVCTDNSYEYEYCLKNLIKKAVSFNQIENFVFDFTSYNFLNVLESKKICRKVIKLLASYSGNIHSRLNKSMLVVKAIEVLGRDEYYSLLTNNSVAVDKQLLDSGVYRSSCFLSKNELLALMRLDSSVFEKYVNYFNPNINFSNFEKLEILSCMLTSDIIEFELFEIEVSLLELKEFVNSKYFYVDTRYQITLFEYLYINDCFIYDSENEFLDFFNDPENRNGSTHKFICKTYDFFDELLLESYENRFEVVIKMYFFKLFMTAKEYEIYFLYLFENYVYGVDLSDVFAEATIDDINRIKDNLGLYFLVRYFDLFSDSLQVYILENLVFTPLDYKINTIDSYGLLYNDLFWKNLSNFPISIQYKFFIQMQMDYRYPSNADLKDSSKRGDYFFNSLEFKLFYLNYLKMFLLNQEVNVNSATSCLPNLEVDAFEDLGEQIINLDDFAFYAQFGDFTTLLTQNSYLTKFLFDLMSKYEFDTSVFKKHFQPILHNLLLQVERYTPVLDLFINDFELEFVLDQIFNLGRDFQLYFSRIAKIKFNKDIDYKNVDMCRKFVLDNFDLKYSLYYLLKEDQAVILKHINFIFEHIDLCKYYLPVKVLKALEFNQVEKKYYNVLFELLENVVKPLTYEFVNHVMNNNPDYSQDILFDRLILMNKLEASVFLEYILRNDAYDLMHHLNSRRVSGRGLLRVLGINEHLDKVYNLIGELDFVIVKIVLYFEGKIALDEQIAPYIADLNSLDDLFAELEIVSQSIKYPRIQPVLDTKISRYLFAVINGFFRVHYSAGMNLEEFYEKLYNIRDFEIVTNSNMQDLTFETDYYRDIQEFVLPQATLEYVEWMQHVVRCAKVVRCVKYVDYEIPDSVYNNLNETFDLINIPDDYQVESYIKNLVNSPDSLNFANLFNYDSSEMAREFCKVNSETLDFSSLTKKQIKGLNQKQRQIYEYISNYPALVVSTLVHHMFLEKNGCSVLDMFVNQLPGELIDKVSLDDLSKLSFKDLKSQVYENGLPRQLLGIVSEYKKIKSFNVFDFPELVKVQTLQVIFNLLPEGMSNTLLFFKRNADFVNWNDFSEFILGLYRDYFSKLTASSKRLSSIKKLIGLNALEDIIEPSRSGLETREIVAHNVRNLFMEFSGFNVDACWADKYTDGIASCVSNVSFYKFSEVLVDSGINIQRGGTLVLEGESSTGTNLWLVRGLNPRNDMYPNFCAESFVNNFLQVLMSKAQKVDAQVCIILDPTHASSTNRRWVRNQYDNLLLEKVEPKVASDFIFNNYVLTPSNMYRVKPESFNSIDINDNVTKFN